LKPIDYGFWGLKNQRQINAKSTPTLLETNQRQINAKCLEVYENN
jgi:hypothetical protein